jgi:hypothetical protein
VSITDLRGAEQVDFIHGLGSTLSPPDPSASGFARELAWAKQKFFVEELIERADGTVLLQVNRGTSKPIVEFAMRLPQ